MNTPWVSRIPASAVLLLLGFLVSVPSEKPRRHDASRDSLLAGARNAVLEGRWGDGAGISDRLVADSSTDLDAQYYGAICRRELGKRTSLFLRQEQWEKARGHFSAVFARDSSFRDILYQYAVFLEYDDDLEGAVDNAWREVLRHPEQVESEAGLFRLGRHYIAETDAREAAEWLGARHDVYAEYFLAELLRRERQFKQAETLLLKLQETPGLPPQATCIALARLYACVGEDGDGLAQASYWNGVDNAASGIGHALIFEDLKPVINDDELDTYVTLKTDGEKIAFVHHFWASRDPLPACAVNARLVEHFRRYATAEREYEYFGVRTLATTPDPTLRGRLPKSSLLNREFNDMGIIYLRHGPPDAYQVSMSTGDDNISWLYNASGGTPARIFIFARHMRVANDWRLSSIPTDPRMKSKIAMWDNRYGIDEQRWPQVGDELESERATGVSQGLTSEHFTWETPTKEVGVPHAIDAFRAPNGKTLLDVSYAVPLEEFGRGRDERTGTLRLEIGISFMAPGGGSSLRELDTLRIPFDRKSTGSYIGLIRRTLAPDSLRIAMHVRSLSEPVVGTWSETFRIPSFQDAGFSLSDLQFLLASTAPASIEIEGVRIVQSPFRSYERNAKLYAYIQIYNLVKDAAGRTKYAAAYDLIPGDPPRPEDAIRIGESTRDLTEDSHADFVRLDLGGARPGRYLLRATVKDRLRVETLTRERAVEILP